MCFDPITFISSSETQSINKCNCFGFDFDSQYSNEMWSEFSNNFFVTSMSDVSSHSGTLNSVIIGCCGEIISSQSFILTDLKLTNIKVIMSFETTNLFSGALIILNCPKICQSSEIYIRVTDQSQLFIIGKIPGFAICERYGHYHSCLKYIDSKKSRLCHFHRVYYRLKALAMKKTPMTASELQVPRFHKISKIGSSLSPISSSSLSMD